MFSFLEACYETSKTDMIGALLGSMNPYLFQDNSSADPALYNHWLKLNNNRNVLNAEDCYAMMLLFLGEMNSRMHLDIADFIERLKTTQSIKKSWNVSW